MASLTMAASLLGSAATVTARPSANRRRLVIANAAASGHGVEKAMSCTMSNEEGSSGRRAVMFAAAAAAISAIGMGQGAAVAGEGDPGRGTPEAKKVYAPICVTMPTARVCHK